VCAAAKARPKGHKSFSIALDQNGMDRIRMLDGCAGIGGNSYAFHSFAQTILYSDVNTDLHPILRSAMFKRLIDTAPIVGDVTKITADEGGVIDFATYGYPCQGNSKMGAGLGLDDARSSLIKGIVTQVKERKIKFVFLENVTEVLRNGSAKFVADQFLAMGYVLAWCVVGAEDVGFRHERRRWFCLAVLAEHFDLLRTCLETSKAHVLERQLAEPPRMQLRREQTRLAALGNGLVPQAAKFAFEYLANVILEQPSDKPLEYFGTDMHSYELVHMTPSAKYELPELRFPNRFPAGAMPLILDPDAYTAPVPPSYRMTTGILTAPVELYAWYTPRHANVGCSNYLTNRSRRDLGTQVRFERETDDQFRHGYLAPQFLEWLMGYPLDYTQILPNV